MFLGTCSVPGPVLGRQRLTRWGQLLLGETWRQGHTLCTALPQQRPVSMLGCRALAGLLFCLRLGAVWPLLGDPETACHTANPKGCGLRSSLSATQEICVNDIPIASKWHWCYTSGTLQPTSLFTLFLSFYSLRIQLGSCSFLGAFLSPLPKDKQGNCEDQRSPLYMAKGLPMRSHQEPDPIPSEPSHLPPHLPGLWMR